MALNHLYALPIALQEKCSDIIDYAAAELRDVCDGFQSTINCPVLSSLASADRTKAVALNWFVICHLHFLLYISPKYHDRLLGYIIYILIYIYITPPGFYMLLNTVAIFLEPLQLMIKEYAVTSVFRLNGLYYPVDITTEESAPLNSFPWIKPSNFIRSMVRMNDLDHLLGGFTLPQARGRLVDFWAKYRVLFPRHQLWEDVDAGRKDPACCVPILIHGDEGVTYKKNGLLVLSFQGVWGHGSSKRNVDYRAVDEGIPLNFLRTGFQTRMLICVCPKEYFWVSKHMLESCMHGLPMFRDLTIFMLVHGFESSIQKVLGLACQFRKLCVHPV